MKRILFFDPILTGHHSEYIRHLIIYVSGLKNNVNYYFVVGPGFFEKFSDIVNNLINSPNVFIIEISKDEYSRIFSAPSLFNRSLNEYKVMNKYASQLKVNECVLLYLNGMQFALGLYSTEYALHGILFGQYTWQIFPDTFKGKLYKMRKQIQTWLLVRNNKLKSVFLLNDVKSCIQLNKIYKTNVFKYLPDPVPDMKANPDFNLREHYGIGQRHKIYLHTGALEFRKGTIEIIDAANYLDTEISQNIAIIIAGRATAALDEQIRKHITNSKNKNIILYENTFIADNVLKSMFEQTDYVLIPYKNTESSSGILGHAIHNNKTVIGPVDGLLGHLIKEHKLGYLIDGINGKNIAEAITEAYYADATSFKDSLAMNNYLEANTASAFSKIIMSALNNNGKQ